MTGNIVADRKNIFLCVETLLLTGQDIILLLETLFPIILYVIL